MKHRKLFKSFDMFIMLSKWEVATAEVVNHFTIFFSDRWSLFSVHICLKLHTQARYTGMFCS